MVSVIRSVGHGALFEGLQAEGVGEGRVVVVSVEAIRARSGARWPTKQETVWDFAQKQFRKDYTARDHLMALDDTSYLIVKADGTSAAAKGQAVNYLRGIIQFFLGESTIGDIRVGCVTQVREGELEQEILSAIEIERVIESFIPAADDDNDARKRSAAVPIEVRRYDVLFTSEPIWAVRRNAMVACRLRPQVFEYNSKIPLNSEELARAAPHEIIGLDLIILEEAISILSGTGMEAKSGLHVPINITCLNSASGRKAIISRLGAAGRQALDRLVICLTGLDRGVPRVVLDHAVAMLQPFALGVVGQAASLNMDVATWRGARLAGVTLDLDGLGLANEANLQPLLSRFAAGAEPVGRACVLYGVSSRAQAIAAWAAGFTDLSGELFRGDENSAFTPTRFAPLDLYPNFSTRKVG